MQAKYMIESNNTKSFTHALGLFITVNICFILFVSTLYVFFESSHSSVLYLCLLFFLLSIPVFFVKSVTGPYVLLVISGPFFFLMYGLSGLVDYFSGDSFSYVSNSRGLMSAGEYAILLGILSLYAGSIIAVNTLKPFRNRWFVKDWNEHTVIIVGLACFTLGMVATFVFQTNFSINLTQKTQLSSMSMNAIVLGRMVGDLSEVLLSYAMVKSKNKTIKIMVLCLIAFKLPLGILLNSKFIGVSFIITYVVVAWLYQRKVPFRPILIGGIAISLMFPLAYQYRAFMGKHKVTVGGTLDNISENLDKAFNSSNNLSNNTNQGVLDKLQSGIDSIAERSNLKPTIEMIVDNTGKGIPYQSGHTLTPLFYILIPRIIYPGKPDVQVGRLFNREFRISADPDTYISTSFLGELYWNYSWSGLIVGMMIIGFTFGAAGRIYNMDDRNNISRILIILTFVYALVFKFQTGIAQQYSVCIRTIIIITFLHILFSSKRSD